MKKLLLLLALISFFGVQGQYQTSTPWMEGFDVNSKSTKIKFKDIVDAGEAYFDNIDKLAKGSGYKQFKRWEAYWQDFVGSDGMVPTSTELWEAWLDVESQSNFRNPLADESNWTSLGPVDFVNRPFSSGNIGRLNVVVQDPSNSATLYAGAPSGGIWKSTDSGANWTQLIDFALPTIGVSGIAIDKNDSDTIYIATGDDDNADSPAIGIWKSTDGGNTWAQTGLNPSNSPGDLNDIFINPNNSQELWVGTSNGVYRTTNGGTSWTTALSGIGIKAIEVKPNDATTLYAISSNRFYKSTDSGASFSQQGTGIPANSGRMVIDVTPANPDLVYLVSTSPSPNYSFQGVFKSTDSGSTFVQTLENDLVFEYFGPGSQQISQAWYDLCIAVSPTDANEVYFGVVDIYKSSDGGDNFNRINYWYTRDAAYTHADIHHLQFFGNELFVASDGGVFKTNNGGTTFSDLTNGMAISQFYRVDVSEQTSNKINGGLQDNGGYGYFNTWYNYHGGDGMEGVIDPNNDNLYYGFSQFGGTLNVSSNSGQGGTSSFSGPGNGNWITPLSINSESEVYAGYSNYLYRFTGSAFEITSGFLGGTIDVLEIDRLDPDIMYIAINNTLRKSLNRGASFSQVEAFGSNITSIEVNNNDSNIVYVTTSGFNGGVYRSTDGGLNFTEITGSLPTVTKNMIKHRPDDILNNLYLATNVGVYRYDDNTADWEVFNNNLPNVSVRDLAINIVDEIIVAGTYGRGLWTSPLQSTQQAQYDISMISVETPSSGDLFCGDIYPQITVKNNGINTVNQIDVTYSIDAGANENFTWNGSLASGESTQIDLPVLAGLPVGEHDLDVSLNITNDAFPSNNAGDQTFFSNGIGIAQLVNTFETPEEELITFNAGGDTPLFERGVPTGALLNTAVSGTQVYGTNLDGDHTNGTIAYLYSQCYNLSNIIGPVLKFHMAFEIELDWDLAYVQYTTDGGDNWSLLGSASDPNWYNSSRFAGDGIADNCYNCVGAQWTGTNAVMTEYSYALDALTNESEVIFRIVFHADPFVVEEGIIVDNFYVDGTLSAEEFELGGFLIYPNPSDDIFNIRTANAINYDFTLTDLTGKIVRKVTDVNAQNYQLDMSGMAAGIYFLRLESEGRVQTKKLILK